MTDIFNKPYYDLPICDDWQTKKDHDGNKIQYLNIPMSFDIETSSFYDHGNKRGIMYLWSFAIEQDLYFGRTWSDFLNLINNIITLYDTNPHRRVIVYVHNLSFEFAFICKWFDWYDTFCAELRRPIYAITTNGIEFRCSYILSGLSLFDLSLTLNNPNLVKRIGYLDYDKIRHSKTPITPAELEYSGIDSLVVTAYIRKCIDDEGGKITKIPYTKTAYARRYCRRSCLYGDDKNKTAKQYKKYTTLMEDLTVQPKEYLELKRAFCGGFTHCSYTKSDKTFDNVASYDLTSSYPTVMVAERFPMSKGKRVKIHTAAELDKLCQNYCVMFEVQLTDVNSTNWYEHYLSYSKCQIPKGAKYTVDNGRIVSADILSTTLTNIDWDIIKHYYSWSDIKIKNVICYQAFYLPTEFVKPILTLYRDKTKLKGLQEQKTFYMRAKTILNACYGMIVTDIVKPLVKYDNIKGWYDDKPNLDKSISEYDSQKGRFLFYPWGVWVTAYARRNLFLAINHLSADYIYSDTDSVKFLNPDKHKQFFDDYNKNIIDKLKKACDYHKLPYDYILPQNQKGKICPLGVWDFEGIYTKFKSLGAKRYLTMTTDQEGLHYATTVAGLGKKAGADYLLKTYKTTDKIFAAFNNELYFPKGKAGKNIFTYLDDEYSGTVTDYLGNTADYSELSGVHGEPADFTLNMAKQYWDYLLGARDIFPE